MRKNPLFLIAVAMMLALTISLAMPIAALADAGNFSGDGDYGGNSNSGSSWDSSSSYDSSHSGGGASWLTVVIIIVIVVVVVRNKAKNGNHVTGGIPVAVPLAAAGIGSLDMLKERDPDFSKEAFLEKVSNMYVQLQEAWEAKKWEPIRMLMTDALFNQFNRQLEEYIKNNQTNHVDRIAVLSTEVTGYRQDEVNDIITVLLKTRIVDFVTNDVTGELVRGNKNKELFMTYEWTLIRAKGVKTFHQEGESQTRCPSCGAPISINQSGK
jgi:hypothetical protein